jgi:hypothetical protein
VNELKPETLQEIFEGAVALLEHEGWGQGVEVNLRGEYCMAGAMKAAMRQVVPGYEQMPLGPQMSTWLSVLEAIAPLMLDQNSLTLKRVGVAASILIPHWNDAPDRTQGEVEEKLRLAAKEMANCVREQACYGE